MSIAAELLRHLEQIPSARQNFRLLRGAFCFGNTAPDVQVVSGDQREITHFFRLPFQPDEPPAWEQFLARYPQLAKPNVLPAEQATFIAGYLCHLQADWLWVKEIFAPIFGPNSPWGTFKERLYLHNVLRTYLDQQVMETLLPEGAACLGQVFPQSWLPFVADPYLLAWREFLARQLKPGAAAETVQVFAERQGISPTEYFNLLESPDRMDQEVFVHVSRQQLAHFRQNLILENLKLLDAYLTIY